MEIGDQSLNRVVIAGRTKELAVSKQTKIEKILWEFKKSTP